MGRDPVRTCQPGTRAHGRNGKRPWSGCKSRPLVAGKKVEAQLQSCVKQTRGNRQSLKLKANMSKVRFWDTDGNKLTSPPAELRGRKALVAIGVQQLRIMGQLPGLLMEAGDIKLQDASSPECPL